MIQTADSMNKLLLRSYLGRDASSVSSTAVNSIWATGVVVKLDARIMPLIVQYNGKEGGRGMILLDSPWIERNPNVLAGHPVVAGTRVPVWVLKSHAENGMPVEQLAIEYNLTFDQVREVLRIAQSFSPEQLGAPDDDE